MDIECREGLDIAGLLFIWSVQPLIYTLKSALKYALILYFFFFVSFYLYFYTYTKSHLSTCNKVACAPLLTRVF